MVKSFHQYLTKAGRGLKVKDILSIENLVSKFQSAFSVQLFELCPQHIMMHKVCKTENI